MPREYDRDRSSRRRGEPGRYSSAEGYDYEPGWRRRSGRGTGEGRELWGRGGVDYEPGDYDFDFDYDDQGWLGRGRVYARPSFNSRESYGQSYGREYGPLWEYRRRRSGPGRFGFGREFGRPEFGAQEADRSRWAVSGPFVGRGPRGYRRPDERIYEEVCERLTQHGQIDASEIEVQVKDGEVTLTGLVESRSEKRAAEDAIENLSGLRDVHNRLRVRQRLGVEGWPRGETGLPPERAEQRGWAARSSASEAALTGHGEPGGEAASEHPQAR